MVRPRDRSYKVYCEPKAGIDSLSPYQFRLFLFLNFFPTPRRHPEPVEGPPGMQMKVLKTNLIIAGAFNFTLTR